ncbi:unnamed protein product [Trifolium pratense]|uniref:Uncharacterized protein n=1 Tax=Trifolium pratense TaxID=57577 RepID=A0ACB0LBN5_TRIPR|nr:unnamed protein product [Trifolium pratense]
MGFRNLHLFNLTIIVNLAMIVKQDWRFITQPDTLVAKSFKTRWSIGNGTNIRVMGDPCLREEDGLWINSPQEQGNYHVDINQEQWKDIWKVHAPPKTKHLLWRICKDCLPT